MQKSIKPRLRFPVFNTRASIYKQQKILVMNKKFILFVLLLTSIAAGASAQTIYGRERSENYRIQEGVRNGSIGRGEERRLDREQRYIHQDIRRAHYNDGYINPYERANIRREERFASRDIYRAKHNGRYCY